MMKKWIGVFILTIYASFGFACSTFLLNKNGHYVFGRNYDWVSGNGAVMINYRSIQKTSFAPEGGKTISWVSKWGSMSFNQFGKEFPHGGMNEKGLVVELMWLTETSYPAADDRAALNELQWIQYQLDNSSTVEEVVATDKLIRISRQNAAPLHYLIADANGHAATIEFINGKMVTHAGKNLAYPVLTNTVYEDAVQQAKQNKVTDNSVERFATACRLLQKFSQPSNKEKPVDAAFTILDKIAQGNYTKWRIVYDISNRSVYFITNDRNKRKELSFSNFDFACTGQTLYLNLNNGVSGNVHKKFSPLNFDQNKNIISQSARESKSQITITQQAVNAAAEYYKTITCRSSE
jgi:penicillin V acylase-like amidase (Ntn superfamily)